MGTDHINIRHLKHLGPLAIQYLTDLLNLALNHNIIPQIWKLAKIIPIPKPNKDTCIGTSYRPISLLSPISKILEKVLFPYVTHNIPQKQTSTRLQTHPLNNHCPPSNNKPNHSRFQSKATPTTYHCSGLGSQ